MILKYEVLEGEGEDKAFKETTQDKATEALQQERVEMKEQSLQRFYDTQVQLVKYLRRIGNSLFVYGLIEQGIAYHWHKCPRNPMAGTVYCSDNDFAIFSGKPIEVAAYNIFGLE